jgi:hypothetical protein
MELELGKGPRAGVAKLEIEAAALHPLNEAFGFKLVQCL